MTLAKSDPACVTQAPTATRNAYLGACAVLQSGAFPPVAGDFVRTDTPSSSAIPMRKFTEAVFLHNHIQHSAAHFENPDRDAVTLSCFYIIVRALVVVPLASLLTGDIVFAPDLDSTFLSVTDDGKVTGVWPSTDDRTGSLEALCRFIGARIALALDQLVPAFRAGTRLTDRSLARAASMPVANSLTHIGRYLGDARAQKIAKMVLHAGTPRLRPVEYIHVEKNEKTYFAVRPPTCCLAYRLHEGEMCVGCPREAEPGRTERHLKWLLERIKN